MGPKGSEGPKGEAGMMRLGATGDDGGVGPRGKQGKNGMQGLKCVFYLKMRRYYNFMTIDNQLKTCQKQVPSHLFTKVDWIFDASLISPGKEHFLLVSCL